MTDPIIQRLEFLASGMPYKDGFHLGMRDNKNAIELEFGQMLLGAVLDRKPETIVELGTGPGYATAWMLAALERNGKGHLWSLDPAMPQPPVWEQVGCPVERLTYLNELTHEALDKLPPEIDILFHDASHNFDEVHSDIESLGPRIPVGGLILVHDVNYSRSMGDQLINYFDARPDEWSYQEISSGCGMGIAKRLRKGENSDGNG